MQGGRRRRTRVALPRVLAARVDRDAHARRRQLIMADQDVGGRLEAAHRAERLIDRPEEGDRRLPPALVVHVHVGGRAIGQVALGAVGDARQIRSQASLPAGGRLRQSVTVGAMRAAVSTRIKPRPLMYRSVSITSTCGCACRKLDTTLAISSWVPHFSSAEHTNMPLRPASSTGGSSRRPGFVHVITPSISVLLIVMALSACSQHRVSKRFSPQWPAGRRGHPCSRCTESRAT